MKYISSFIVALFLMSPLSVLADEITLAGGCFWCLEHDLETVYGINSVRSGYSGGDLKNPNYENHNGHQEVVLVEYDSQTISLSEILRLYLRNIDPLDGRGQFCDRGDSYKPVIFFDSPEEENVANTALISAANELDLPYKTIAVELKPKVKFWLAEDYHQNFAERNEFKYKFYRFTCGRDQKLDEIWGENARSIIPWS